MNQIQVVCRNQEADTQTVLVLCNMPAKVKLHITDDFLSA